MMPSRTNKLLLLRPQPSLFHLGLVFCVSEYPTQLASESILYLATGAEFSLLALDLTKIMKR